MENNIQNFSTDEDTEHGDLTLAAYLRPGISSEELPTLQAAQHCSSLFLLLKELVRAHLNDFWIKMAVLLVFSQDKHKTKWTPQELSNDLHWLQEGARKKIIGQLSRSNWLTFNEGNYELSSFGRNLLSMLMTIMQQQEVPDALGANISSLNLLEMYQHDPTNTLRMFLNELVRVDEDIQATLGSNSEYLIRKMNKRVRSQFEIAIKSREHLENLPSNDFNAYRLKQEIHERLSGFHARLSQVQRVQNDLVARKIILADKSLSQHDINAFLINSSVDELANLGKSLISSPISVTDLIPQLMVYEAEWQLEKERNDQQRRGWTDFEMADEGKEDLVNRSHFMHFVGEIQHMLERKKHFTVENFVPFENWGYSSFRFSMLSVLEGGEIPLNFNIASKKTCPKLQVTYDSDDICLPVAELNDQFSGVKEITKGNIAKAEE